MAPPWGPWAHGWPGPVGPARAPLGEVEPVGGSAGPGPWARAPSLGQLLPYVPGQAQPLGPSIVLCVFSNIAKVTK